MQGEKGGLEKSLQKKYRKIKQLYESRRGAYV
jgi:hypothetical protein